MKVSAFTFIKKDHVINLEYNASQKQVIIYEKREEKIGNIIDEIEFNSQSRGDDLWNARRIAFGGRNAGYDIIPIFYQLFRRFYILESYKRSNYHETYNLMLGSKICETCGEPANFKCEITNKLYCSEECVE